MKQSFNCYKYGHILVYCQKNTKCRAYLGPYQTSKCSKNQGQKCTLNNVAHTSWDKHCEYEKNKYLQIEAAKQNTSLCHKISFQSISKKKEDLRNIRPPLRLQQKF